MPTSPKSHQTTIRFSVQLWRQLEEAAADLDVSVAQYLRDAARARLEGAAAARHDELPVELERELDSARTAARERVQDSRAVWQQARQARLRAAEVRADAINQRRRHSLQARPGTFQPSKPARARH